MGAILIILYSTVPGNIRYIYPCEVREKTNKMQQLDVYF